MYKALFFDVDDTLLNFERCSQEALRKTFHYFHITYGDNIYELFRDIDNQLWVKQRQGALSVQDVLNLRFRQLFEQLHLRDCTPAFQDMFQEKLSEEVFPEPCAEESLLHLSSRYKLFAASNGLLKTQLKRLKLAGLLRYFWDVFVSDDIGYEKPNAAFFDECMRRSQLRHSEVLFIGDSMEADIIGANKSHIDSCWYNPKNRDKPFGVKIKYSISDLSQLENILP